ncbi:hypothetical protein QBC34DRAFT_405058 [Podospora aff. communis PSN243]|uniref:Uncharacterized protein n=1 Tax=Podospora aff. communis PSN243 TaxID=3040156 RepID=A0AAV9GP50_9PEZI|nr:hypothetical protein QBC34DRAFT_405058 [Podospora aff. communis PSN243]
MPGLTLSTDPAAGAAHGAAATATTPQPQSQPSAPPAHTPTRPPVSPLTPTFEPRQLPGANGSTTATSNIPSFALGRPLFTHTQPDQTGTVPPPAEPIAFDDNPDVIALKSAISILQLQRARATADMQTLRHAKDAALANPNAFVADLTAGKVGVEGDPVMFPSATNEEEEEDSSSSEDDYEEEDGAIKTEGSEGVAPQKQRKRQEQGAGSSAWSKLPKPQTVVRCPPVNWAQYGVVGESLDRLHAEQIASPTPGTPAVLGPGGTYEFKAGESQFSSEPGRRLVGVAAPYVPGKDKIDKKAKRR